MRVYVLIHCVVCIPMRSSATHIGQRGVVSPNLDADHGEAVILESRVVGLSAYVTQIQRHCGDGGA